jgi:hypothetical protein
MSEQNKKAIIVNKTPKIYQDNRLTLPLDVSLPQDSVFEIEEVEGDNAVRIILPDLKIAYIHGNEEINVIQLSWTINETKVYTTPDELATQPIILPKGQEFELLNLVEDTNNNWLRIRLSEHQIYYMRGNVKIITEDSLIEVIGELIGKGTSEEKIVSKFTSQGVPEEKIRHFYKEISILAAEYKESPEGRKELASKFSKRILYGVLWAVGGTIATFVSMDAASSGGTYYVFYGAIIWGVIDIIRGIIGWVKYS